MPNTINKSENVFSKLHSNPGWVVHIIRSGEKIVGKKLVD